MPLSNYFKAQVINLLSGNISSVSVGAVYMGLSTTTPTASGSNVTEPTGNYTRVLLGIPNQSGTHKMSSATESDPTSENTSAILFDKATANWGTITHAVFYNAVTGGNFLGYAELTNPVTVASGNVARIGVQDLQISVE